MSQLPCRWDQAVNHCLVIGGSRGIGKQIADRLAASYTITVIGRTAKKYAADVTDDKEFFGAVNEIVAHEGPFNHVVFVPRGPLLKMVRAVMRTHTMAIGRRVESMVVVNSIASLYVASEQDEEYHALKGATASLVRYLALASEPEPMRINGVCPGRIREDSTGDCTPYEVADTIRFLLSAESSAVNGQHIVLDRGRSLRLP